MTAPIDCLDTLGLFCPLPIILTSKKMKTMQWGTVLEVLSDDIGIKKDMPIWCKESGNQLIDITEEGTLLKCTIRKTPPRDATLAETGHPSSRPLGSGNK